MMQSPRPTLVTNPTDDQAFSEAAAAALIDARSTDELQAALRRDYPRAVVRDRDLTGDALVWYVYREGHWVRGADRT
jgi:hypothetical protein